MELLIIINWIVGIILSVLFGIMAWITKNKGLWEIFPFIFITMLLTGFITALPIIGVIVITGLNKRFE